MAVEEAAKDLAKGAEDVGNKLTGGLLGKVLSPIKGAFGAAQKATDVVGKYTTVKGLLIWGFFGMAAGAVGAAAAPGVVVASGASALASSTTALATGGTTALASSAGAATNFQILTSFWSGLVTNPLTGEMGIMPGLTNMFNGYGYLFGSGYDVLGAGASALSSGDPILGSMQTALNAPASFSPSLG